MTRLSPYLQRLKQRRLSRQLTNNIVFGLVLGWLLTLLGGFHFLFVIGNHDWLWLTLMIVGIITLITTIAIPNTISYIETPLRKLTKPIGQFVFSIILVVSYFVLVLPVGLLLRTWKGMSPFYWWTEKHQATTSGWESRLKINHAIVAQVNAKNRPLILQPFAVLTYFIRNGHYIFIPALIFLLSIGLVMFFVKSSALAPFIYTLF